MKRLSQTDQGTNKIVNVVDPTSAQDSATKNYVDSGTKTISNTRVNPRSNSITSAATITPTGDSSDQYNVTAQAVTGAIAAPSGTPFSGQKLIFTLRDNGTPQGLSWDAIYRAYTGVTLPTITTAGKKMYFAMIYSAGDTKWDVLAVIQQV